MITLRMNSGPSHPLPQPLTGLLFPAAGHVLNSSFRPKSFEHRFTPGDILVHFTLSIIQSTRTGLPPPRHQLAAPSEITITGIISLLLCFAQNMIEPANAQPSDEPQTLRRLAASQAARLIPGFAVSLLPV